MGKWDRHEGGTQGWVNVLQDRRVNWKTFNYKTRLKNIIKYNFSSISLDVLILTRNSYSLRQKHPDKILPVVGVRYMWKAKRILPTQVQTLKPACIALFFRCWGRKCNCLQAQTKRRRSGVNIKIATTIREQLWDWFDIFFLFCQFYLFNAPSLFSFFVLADVTEALITSWSFSNTALQLWQKN